MNNIVTQNEKNRKRYLPHKLNTRIYAVEMYRNCGDIGYVCRKYHISRTSLWRWNKRYDGTLYVMWEFLKFMGFNTSNPDILSHIKCVLYKSCQWEYEKEWRLIDSTIRGNIILENNTCVTLKPTAIYYGTNMSLDDKRKLHEIALNKGIKEYDMYIDFASEKYEMLYRIFS